MRKPVLFHILLSLLFVCSCAQDECLPVASGQAYAAYREGKTLQQQFYLLRAVDYFQTAESLAGGDSALVCRVNLELGRIARLLMQYDEEKAALEKAFQAAVATRNDSLLVEVLHEKALSNMRNRDFVSARTCLQEVVRRETDTLRLADSEKDMAHLCLMMGENDSALHYIRCAMDRCSSTGIPSAWNLLKGNIFLAMQAHDSARLCLTHEGDSLPLAEHAEAARSMARLKALEGDKEAELVQLKEYIALRESLATDRKEEMMEKIHMVQEYRQQRERADQAEMERGEREVVIHRVLWGMMACIITLLYLHHRHRRNRQQLLAQLQQERLKQMETEIALAREQQIREQKEIESLSRTIDYYRQLNTITLPMLMDKRNSQGMMHLSQEEWDTLVGNTDACFNRFTERLKIRCPQLTEDDLRFCCLVKMELPLSLLAEIYHIAKGSVSRRKMRLKEKLQVTDVSFDEFIRSF